MNYNQHKEKFLDHEHSTRLEMHESYSDHADHQSITSSIVALSQECVPSEIIDIEYRLIVVKPEVVAI